MAAILIVDDRAINREFLATLLGYVGYTVLEASDGAEALEITRTRRPALVITDVLMPHMGGVDFANALHADAAIAHIPIIFYTATYRLSEAQALGQACGVSTVLAKPSEPQAIIAAVAAALGLESTPGELPAGAHAHPGFLGEKLPSYLRELAELQQCLQSALDQGLELIGESGALRHVSDNLLSSFTTVQALSMRLAALLELSLVLPAEQDPERLLNLFCRAAQDIMNTPYAAVMILDDDGKRPLRWASRGLTDAVDDALAAMDPRAGILGEVLAAYAPRRISNADGDPAQWGLPAGHPPIKTLLVVPLGASAPNHGWLYFADKLGGEAFGDDDEQFAATLAAQLALTYGNIALHDEIRQHAVRLEVEVAERKHAMEELQESERRFSDMLGNVQLVSLMLDRQARITYCNDYLLQLTGWRRDEVFGRDWFEVFVPPELTDLKHVFLALLDDDPSAWHHVHEILTRSGQRRLIQWNNSLLRAASGEAIGTASIGEDITERKEQQEKIARLSRIYAILSGINSAIVRVHERQALFEEACRIAVEQGQFGMAWIGLLEPDMQTVRLAASKGVESRLFDKIRVSARADRPEGRGTAGVALRSKRAAFCNDITAEPRVGAVRAEAIKQGYRSTISLPLLVDDAVVGVLVLYARDADFFDDDEVKLLNELAGDISFALQYIEKEEKLDYLAYYDALTGLPNGTLFHDRLTQFLYSKGDKGFVSVILVDLDRFTQLNDTLGRHVGDMLLKSVARRVGESLREPYTLARISADMFAIAVAGLQNDTEAAAILRERVFAPLDRAFTVEGREIRLTAKAGIALYPADGKSAETLFKNAEAALKQAQSSGERYLYYAPEINAQVAQRLALESKLSRATIGEQFVLHYQPKIDTKSGRIIGLEALIRWNNPDAGLVQPTGFIDALEDTGLIVEVGRWVLDRALRDYRGWLDRDLRPPRVAVNVSQIQLKRDDFVETVRQAIETSGAGADGLELEITETLVMGDIEATTDTLTRIRNMGVTIAIDDFGSGYSSLRYLAKLPVDSLKIDRSFIITMVNDSDSMAIVATVISLAHSLNLTVVAEGVDSEEQAKFLKLMKCDEMQGFLFSLPVPADAVETMLRSNAVR